MSTPHPIEREFFSRHTFETLQGLWRQMAASIGHRARLISQIDLASPLLESIDFYYLQSPHFNAVAIYQIVNPDSLYPGEIKILLATAEIRDFLQSPIGQFNPAIEIRLPKRENDPHQQSEFSRLMLAILAPDRSSNREIQLQRQLFEANILDAITRKIHKNAELSSIFQTALDRLQGLLKADRVLLYKFKFARNGGDRSYPKYLQSGQVMYESLASNDVSSLLYFSEDDDCFDNIDRWQEYERGEYKAIADTAVQYRSIPCMIELMQRQEIRSKLIMPIVVGGQLWGLLILHQCRDCRTWQGREIDFVQRVAEHLAFAIYQSELYADSLRQTKDLEQIVAARTQELRDATFVAQTANQSKTEFLALLSHELRTPLTSILGLSATLLRMPGLNLSDRQQTYLQTIHNSGEHLSELVDDILDFYKLEIGKTVLKISEFSLSKLLKQIIEIARPKAELKDIDLRLEIINQGEDVTELSGRDLRFRGDTKRIRQIILNLLTNAFKFTPSGGTTIVRVWLEEEMAVFEVEDNGIGIEAEQIPRLFRKFYQSDSTYGRDYAGMGLGLAITQQLVELHGGQIEVESIVNSGSTFTVRLASQQLQSPSQPDRLEIIAREFEAQTNDNRMVAPKRLILLEQNEDLANFISDILTAARYQVMWLVSTDSAIRQIAVLQPDAVIINLSIGEEFVGRILHNITARINLDNIKIMAISNHEDAVRSTIAESIDEYLYQPIVPEQMLKKIAKLLS